VILRVPPAFSILATIGLLIACGSCSNPIQSAVAAKRRKAAANFALTDIRGAKLSLADYKGEVVLLNFWATWCGPCKVEIPWFVEFQSKYKDRGFTLLGVSMDDDGWKSVAPFVAQHKINYPVVIGNDEVSHLYSTVDSLPTTFIIDREGKIASTHVGLVSKNSYEREITGLLGDE
jgi:peroxiredoxin